jgi:hypothetical protein
MSVLLSLIVVSAPLEVPVALEDPDDAVADEGELLQALTVSAAQAALAASTIPPRRHLTGLVRGLSRRLASFLYGIAIS